MTRYWTIWRGVVGTATSLWAERSDRGGRQCFTTDPIVVQYPNYVAAILLQGRHNFDLCGGTHVVISKDAVPKLPPTEHDLKCTRVHVFAGYRVSFISRRVLSAARFPRTTKRLPIEVESGAKQTALACDWAAPPQKHLLGLVAHAFKVRARVALQTRKEAEGLWILYSIVTGWSIVDVFRRAQCSFDAQDGC